MFLCSRFFPSPLAICRYLLPRLRVVSSVQQLSVALQHVFCSSGSLSGLLASHYSEFLSAYLLFWLLYIVFLVLLVLLCSRTWYASSSLPLPPLIAVISDFLCLTVRVHRILYLSRMKNPPGHWVY